MNEYEINLINFEEMYVKRFKKLMYFAYTNVCGFVNPVARMNEKYIKLTRFSNKCYKIASTLGHKKYECIVYFPL